MLGGSDQVASTDDATLMFSGSLAEISAIFSSISFMGDKEYVGLDTVTVILTDDAGAFTVNNIGFVVTNVNDPPTAISMIVDVAVDANDAPMRLGAPWINVVDVDGDALTAQVRLVNGGGVLSLQIPPGVTSSVVETTLIEVTGSPLAVEAALNAVLFEPSIPQDFGVSELQVLFSVSDGIGVPASGGLSIFVIIGEFVGSSAGERRDSYGGRKGRSRCLTSLASLT